MVARYLLVLKLPFFSIIYNQKFAGKNAWISIKRQFLSTVLTCMWCVRPHWGWKLLELIYFQDKVKINRSLQWWSIERIFWDFLGPPTAIDRDRYFIDYECLVDAFASTDMGSCRFNIYRRYSELDDTPSKGLFNGLERERDFKC